MSSISSIHKHFLFAIDPNHIAQDRYGPNWDGIPSWFSDPNYLFTTVHFQNCQQQKQLLEFELVLLVIST